MCLFLDHCTLEKVKYVNSVKTDPSQDLKQELAVGKEC